MKHTKGKWEATEQEGKVGHCFQAQVFSEEGNSIAILNSTIKEEEATANAKLIAAAPELLEEVELSYLIIQMAANDSIEVAVKTDSTRARMRDLIAKAKGLTPKEAQEACEFAAIKKATS